MVNLIDLLEFDIHIVVFLGSIWNQIDPVITCVIFAHSLHLNSLPLLTERQNDLRVRSTVVSLEGAREQLHTIRLVIVGAGVVLGALWV